MFFHRKRGQDTTIHCTAPSPEAGPSGDSSERHRCPGFHTGRFGKHRAGGLHRPGPDAGDEIRRRPGGHGAVGTSQIRFVRVLRSRYGEFAAHCSGICRDTDSTGPDRQSDRLVPRPRTRTRRAAAPVSRTTRPSPLSPGVSAPFRTTFQSVGPFRGVGHWSLRYAQNSTSYVSCRAGGSHTVHHPPCSFWTASGRMLADAPPTHPTWATSDC